jgi:uncharacterized membrane protein
MDILKKNALIIVILLISLAAIQPLFSPGFFPMHDNTQPTRVYEMAQALKDGQFPVRWVGDLGYGYGYPIFNFYAPLPYYVGAGFVILGFDALIATKIIIGLGVLLAALSMFFLAKKIWGSWGSMISSVLYVFAPYHAVQVYVRGALGELWAYALIPFIFLGVIFVYERKTLKGVLLGGSSFALVILSHNIFGMLLGGILSLFFLFEIIKYILRKADTKIIFGLLGIITIGLGLSAFFWLPALSEAHLTRSYTLTQGTNDFREHFVYLDQLWDWPWGYAGSAPGRADGMSFKIGKVHLIVALIGLLSLIVVIKKTPNSKKVITTLLVLGLITSVFMTTALSARVWELVPPLAYLQYPWRFLVLIVFCVSLLAGAVQFEKYLEAKFFKYIFVTCVVSAVLVWNVKYFQPQYLTPQTAADYTNKDAMIWDISKISDEYLPQNFPIPATQTETAKDAVSTTNDIIVRESDIKSQLWHVAVDAPLGGQVLFSLSPFPGWKFFVDTREVIPSIFGRQQAISLSAGSHLITAYLKDTWVRQLANMISLLSGAIALILLQQLIKNQKKSHE